MTDLPIEEGDGPYNGALYERTSILVGAAGVAALRRARVLVVGVGGVGGHCAEALVRAGVGHITLCDHDVVSMTNKNRQLIAVDSAVGNSKVAECAKRFADINSQCNLTALDAFLLPTDISQVLDRGAYDCVLDCIDSVDCKVALLEACAGRNLRVFSSGGAGGRMDPSKVMTGDIFETQNDALLRFCRNELRKRWGGTDRHGVIDCVFSTELAAPPLAPAKQDTGGRNRAVNGTISYMPPLFGLRLSALAIQFLLDPAADAKRRAAEAKQRAKREAASAATGAPKWRTGASATAVAATQQQPPSATQANQAKQRLAQQQRQQQQQQNPTAAEEMPTEQREREQRRLERRQRWNEQQQQQQQERQKGQDKCESPPPVATSLPTGAERKQHHETDNNNGTGTVGNCVSNTTTSDPICGEVHAATTTADASEGVVVVVDGGGAVSGGSASGNGGATPGRRRERDDGTQQAVPAAQEGAATCRSTDDLASHRD